jgi:hypothetical protein
MGTILAAVAALVVSGGATLLDRILPSWWGRVGRGAAVWLGMAAGLLVLWLSADATNLLLILGCAALVAGLVGAALELCEVHWLLGALAALLVLGATMALEYRRGDLFAVTAAVGAVVGVVVMQVVAFATRAAQASGAPRTPAVVAVLGAAYLFVVASGLPNPGLAMTVLVVGAATLPLAVLPGSGAADRALGPVLAAAGWGCGVYAWLANASPAMVLAPIAVVGVDVGWTLVRRLVTVEGRTRLASAGNGWRRLRAWGEPADDLVVQRAAAATSVRAATTWLVGATVVVLVLSAAQWWLAVRWLPELATIALLGLGWLLVQLGRIHLSRADLVAWLAGLTALGALLAVAAHLTDGRRLVTLLPLVVVLAVWAAAVPSLSGRVHA